MNTKVLAIRRQLAAGILLASLSPDLPNTGVQPADRRELVGSIKRLTRNTRWQLVSSTRLAFQSFHPQGLVKLGDSYYLSSVEVLEKPETMRTGVSDAVRTPGKGIGHLFHFDASGKMLNDLRLGEGAVYHPGGIDFDGHYLWVPVAEYRPDSRSIIYRIDPRTLKSTEILRWKDHLGAVAYDESSRTLTAASWGSRKFYKWQARKGHSFRLLTSWPNPSFFIDYQDCKQLGPEKVLCNGISTYEIPGQKEKLVIGGLGLVDTSRGITEYEFPMDLRTPDGISMNRNPFWIETAPSGLRLYFIPEDDNSTLYIYESK